MIERQKGKKAERQTKRKGNQVKDRYLTRSVCIKFHDCGERCRLVVSSTASGSRVKASFWGLFRTNFGN